MADQPNTAGASSGIIENEGFADGTAAASSSAIGLISDGESSETIALLEEALAVSKRRRLVGRVRVTTHTDVTEDVAEVELDRYRVEVTRVPIGQVVDAAPAARAEGDTTIIPVIEERMVVIKQLFLREELHVRHVVLRETVSEPVTLRRQRAVVDRFDEAGNPTDHDHTSE